MAATSLGKPERAGLRLAELVASLSLATDLGLGQPLEWALRSCLLAVRFGDALGLGDEELTDVYYLALLRFAGCTAASHETALLFGDDVAFNARMLRLLGGNPLQARALVLRSAVAGGTPLARARRVGTLLTHGAEIVEEVDRGHCEAARGVAARLGFPRRVQDALWQVFERWDGRGGPNGIKGEALALPVRIVQLAHDAELYRRLDGVESARAVVRERAGSAFDPALAERFGSEATRLFADADRESAWDAVLAAEPGPRPHMDDAGLDAATRAMADFVDLKSPYLVGHSAGVAALVDGAARRCRLPEEDVALARRAGHLHDLGRVAVSSGIWGKPGPLTEAEWERVRLHPYYTERVCARAPVLARLGAIAALHHERLDGSGYHRGLPVSLLPPVGRLLAAADAYAAMTEPRPHRLAISPDQAAEELRREVRAGRLDGEATEAVLGAAGHRATSTRRTWPAGLSEREVEILRLIARGRSNPQVAAALSISPKTVGHHVQHIYDKAGVSSRAGATLFAMQHDLLRESS